MRDRCATIDLCIGYYMDNGVRKPRTKRTLHELYADRQREAELEDELRQHKDIIDILKKIYFKAKQPLRECINVGFSGADIVRCFFTRNDLTNREIYKLAVNNTNMSDNRKEFFIELIESERDWNDFFGVQYGYRIPWMEWIDSFEPSLEGLQVFDVLNNGKMLQSIEEEKLDNDVIWDPYSIEPLDNGMDELHPDQIAIQGHISDKITKSKKKRK
uniref:Uncharacterized protein n=1 Tax=Panagrolaimus superbus TaxID=310955 RepID=A0A914YDX8_9BILA